MGETASYKTKRKENGLKYYVEFSIEQNCFHIDTMENIQESNRELLRRGINNGYVVIAGPMTANDAHSFCSSMQHLKKGKMDYATQG